MLGYMVNKSVVTHTGCVIVCLLLLFSVWFHFISSLLFKAVQWHLYEVNWWHSADLPVSVGSGHFRVSGFIFVSNGVKIFRMQSQEKSHETLLNVHESTMFCRQLSANTNWCLKILHTAHIFVAYFIICWYRAGSILYMANGTVPLNSPSNIEAIFSVVKWHDFRKPVRSRHKR